MKNKKSRNGTIYFFIVIVSIIVYLVIYLYCDGLRKDIYKDNSEYENNLNKQPINNIIAIEKKNEPIDEEITDISFVQNNISIKKGNTAKLIIKVTPIKFSSSKFTWKSSNPNVVTVDSNGVIKGINAGSAIITVTSPNGKTDRIKVTVTPNEIKAKKITLIPDKLILNVGDLSQITAIIEPVNATNISLVWESSNPLIATVDDNGIVKGINPGTTIITVKTKDGTIAGQVIVTVKPLPTPTATPFVTPSITPHATPLNTPSSTPSITPLPTPTVKPTIKPTVKPSITATPIPIDEDITFEYEYDGSNYIYLINQFPIKDEVGKLLQGDKYTHDFKLRFDETAVGVRYIITVEKLEDSSLDDEWAKLFLVNDGNEVLNCYRANNRVKTYNEYTKYNGKNTERIIYEGIISSAEASRGYKDFTFRMWVSEDLKLVNSDYLSETKTFKVRVNVYAVKN